MFAPAESRMIKQFSTENGTLVPAVTTEQMIEIDRVAIEKTGPALLQMMENAGRNLAEMAIQILGKQWREAVIVVLAGSGGNGGGGICAARHLANRNVDVRLCLANPDCMSESAANQYHIYLSTPGREVSGTELANVYPDLIIDALIGYNLQNVPNRTFAELIEWANNSEAPVLSLDVPSGIDATTGEAPGICILPQWTMTLALPKTGLHAAQVGDLWLADIGIPEGAYRQLAIQYNSPFGKRFRVALSEAPTDFAR